jgi:ABC-type sugar transport system permease subunit
MKLSQTISANGARPKKRKIASLDRRKARAGWIFVLPFVIGFVLIYLPMVFDSIKLSFTEIKYLPGGGFDPQWVGTENYEYALFTDPAFVQTLISGLKQLIFDIPAILIFSLFMAVLLNQKMVGRAAFRAIFFVPVVLSTGIMESIDAQNILDDYMGSSNGIDDGSGSSAANQIVNAMDVQRLFANMKIGTELTDYVVGMVNDIFNIVNRSGVQMLIFLAALQSISPAIYESCRIDGATAWETFWKITLPMISPMILVNGVYTVIDSFTTDSNVVMKFVANQYTQAGGQTISSAMAWMYFLIIILIVAVVGGICSAFVFYQKKDM